MPETEETPKVIVTSEEIQKYQKEIEESGLPEEMKVQALEGLKTIGENDGDLEKATEAMLVEHYGSLEAAEQAIQAHFDSPS